MRVTTIIERIVHQMVRDKRTLALMMIAPMVILTLINFLFETDSAKLKVGVYETTTAFNHQLAKADLEIVEYKNVQDITKIIKQDQLTAFIKQENAALDITYENSIPSATAQLKMKIQASLASLKITQLTTQLQAQAQKGSPSVLSPKVPPNKLSFTDHYVYGDEQTSFFDTISPVFIGFFVFLFVFLISGVALLRERTTGTLDRLLATPIRRGEIVTGYLAGYGIFAIIQTLIVITYAIYILKIEINGSIALVFLVNIIIAIIALSMGIMLSTFANSELQMLQFIPITVVPQVFFAGLIPIEDMADWLQVIAHLMPLYYGGDALQNVMTKGFTMTEIRLDLGILVLFALVFSLLNVIGLKRYRKI